MVLNKTTRTVHIPNEEIRLEFSRAIRQVKRDDTIRRVRESEQLIADTVHGNEAAVARQIAKIHDRHYPKTIKGYGDDILLVGISNDKEAQAGKRKHHCRIEKYMKE